MKNSAVLLLASSLYLFGTSSAQTGPSSPQVYPAPNVTASGDWADAVRKAQKFVARLTLAEKVNLTTGVDTSGRCVGNTGTVPRIGFAGLCLEDSPLGVRDADLVSAFPAGINAAMTFDKELIHERGVAMGQEHRGKGVNVQLGPDVNMAREAAAGRNWEGFGADPFLTGVAAALTIEGVQSNGVIACAKHFVGNEQEHNRGGGGGGENATSTSSDISDRTMHEIYAWPFGESVKAGVGSIMCSYQRINSTFACENSKTIIGLAKEEWDFKGFMVSDWTAVEGGIESAMGGLDMNMPGFIGYGHGADQTDPVNATNSFWGRALFDFVNNGQVPEWRVTDMVTRTMAAFFKMGQDKNYPPVNFDYSTTNTTDKNGNVINEHVNVQGDHFKTIRKMGAASTVLLKHTKNSLLPLASKRLPKTIAIIGSDAGPNPNGPNSCPNGNNDRGCSIGTLAMGWGSGTTNFPYLVDPLSAITNWAKGQRSPITIKSSLDDFDLDQASSIASTADLCMVFSNADSGEGYITVDGNAGDRNNLTLWHNGDALISATASRCKNTVVVLHTVGAVIMEPWIDSLNITDVLFAGLPGQESGNALLDVLTGAVNPSGRLPFTIAKNPSDYPAQVVFDDPSGEAIIHVPYSEELNIDYRHFDSNGIQPRFEFGFGLSYTSFEYSGLSVSKAGSFGRKKRADEEDEASNTPTLLEMATESTPTLDVNGNWTTAPDIDGTEAPSFPTGPIVVPMGDIGGNARIYDDAVDVSFRVRNAGSSDGAEVAQVYLGFPKSAQEPPRILRGFDKQLIRRGGSASFSITLRNKDVAIWDVVKQAWTIPEGTFTVFVGASSRDIRLQKTFNNPTSITLKAS